MKHTLTAFVLGVALLLASGGSGYAQDFQKGVEAYEKGDYATALREWRPLAEQGDADAQFELGVMYSNGQGVTQDYKEGVKWYRLSAEQGNASAQSNLGFMYREGLGVIQDNVYAHMWYNIAASNGNEVSPIYRDDVAERMTSEQLAEAQKLARECVRKKYKGC